MKHRCLILAALAACLMLFTTGCASYCELSLYQGPRLKLENGEEPLAAFNATNVAYYLFGCIPLTTGDPWEKGHYTPNKGGFTFFESHCSLEDNLTTLRSALHEVKSNRIYNLNNYVDDSYAWSLFLIRRHIAHTSCVIVKPTSEVDLKKVAPNWTEE